MNPIGYKHGPILLAALILVIAAPAVAGSPHYIAEPGEQVCNAEADLFLALADYPRAIRFHRRIIARDPKNSLAHYHLGFAYGMMGRQRQEMVEYGKAVSLGLTDWTLLLNLGVAFLKQGNARSADVLGLAVLMAPRRPETHYNLALAYNRLTMLDKAAQEALVALILAPRDPDVRNTLALLYAEHGNYAGARREWSELLLDNPGYESATENLAILDRVGGANSKRVNSETAVQTVPEPQGR